MVLIKISKFSVSLFFFNWPRYSLVIFQIENKAFQTTKITLEQSQKLVLFRKGLTHGFGLKFEVSSKFVFLLKRPRYTVGLRSTKKQGFLDSKNNIRAKSKDFHFSKGVNQQEPITWDMGSCEPMILVKNFEFTLRSFFFKIGLDKPFDYVQHRKQGLETIKMTLEKTAEIFIFPKGSTHGFGLKF